MKESTIHQGRSGWFYEVWDVRGLVAHGWRPTREQAAQAVAHAQIDAEEAR